MFFADLVKRDKPILLFLESVLPSLGGFNKGFYVIPCRLNVTGQFRITLLPDPKPVHVYQYLEFRGTLLAWLYCCGDPVLKILLRFLVVGQGFLPSVLFGGSLVRTSKCSAGASPRDDGTEGKRGRPWQLVQFLFRLAKLVFIEVRSFPNFSDLGDASSTELQPECLGSISLQLCQLLGMRHFNLSQAVIVCKKGPYNPSESKCPCDGCERVFCQAGEQIARLVWLEQMPDPEANNLIINRAEVSRGPRCLIVLTIRTVVIWCTHVTCVRPTPRTDLAREAHRSRRGVRCASNPKLSFYHSMHHKVVCFFEFHNLLKKAKRSHHLDS